MVTQHWTDNERHKEPLDFNVLGLAEMFLFSNLRTDGFSHSFFCSFESYSSHLIIGYENVSIHEFENIFIQTI
jgi:hypothetical protein